MFLKKEIGANTNQTIVPISNKVLFTSRSMVPIHAKIGDIKVNAIPVNAKILSTLLMSLFNRVLRFGFSK